MKRLYAFVFMILALIIVLSSCDWLGMKEKKPATKTVVILCDLSESTKEARNTYLESFKAVLKSISHGDVLILAKITAASITDTDLPIKEVFPDFIPKDKSGNPTDNKLLVEAARKHEDEKLALKKDELIGVMKKTLNITGEKRKRILKTDIMTALHVADKAFKNYNRDKLILVVLSDMYEESSRYDFRKERLTGKRIDQIIGKEKALNRLPDLKNAKVYVSAAGAGESENFFSIQNFWLKYFTECGATLKKENYGSTLVNFSE